MLINQLKQKYVLLTRKLRLGDANNVKSLLKSAVESELKVIRFGIAKTKRKLEDLEKNLE